MKKRRNKPHRQRRASWPSIQMALMSASIEQQSDDVHLWLVAEAYTALDKLTNGTFTLTDMLTLTKLSIFTQMLAETIYPGLSDESRAVVDQHQPVIEQAGHSLNDLVDRFERTGKWGATGGELSAFRAAFSLLDTLTEFATRGETTRAMLKTDELTESSMRRYALNRKKHDTDQNQRKPDSPRAR